MPDDASDGGDAAKRVQRDDRAVTSALLFSSVHPIIAQLRDRREKRNITRVVLAEQLHVSEQSLYRYELGNKFPSIMFVHNWAHALDFHLTLSVKPTSPTVSKSANEPTGAIASHPKSEPCPRIESTKTSEPSSSIESRILSEPNGKTESVVRSESKSTIESCPVNEPRHGIESAQPSEPHVAIEPPIRSEPSQRIASYPGSEPNTVIASRKASEPTNRNVSATKSEPFPEIESQAATARADELSEIEKFIANKGITDCSSYGDPKLADVEQLRYDRTTGRLTRRPVDEKPSDISKRQAWGWRSKKK